MICAIYVRKSKQDENSQSMETQIQMCMNYIESHYKNASCKVYDKDYGITGHSIKKRKDFQRMMSDVKSGLIDVVLVQRYDRLNRNMRDFCNTYYELENNSCALVSVSQDIDTSTPYGKKFMYDLASTAELEWALNSERRKDVNRYAVSVGKCNLSEKCIPTGYKIEKINNIRKVVFDEKTKPHIEEMIRYLQSGGSRSSVIPHINSMYGTEYKKSLIATFKRSSFYYGTYRDNQSFCPSYLAKEEWEKLTKKKTTRIYEFDDDEKVRLFTSLIRCPVCGNTLESCLRKTEKYGIYRYYRCQQRWHTGIKFCDFSSSLSETTIEKYLLLNIEHELNKFVIDTKEKQKKKPKSKIKDYENELNRVNTMFQKGRISEDKYDEEYLRLSELIHEEKAKQELSNVENIQYSFPKNWKEIYNSLNRANKKRFWLSTIEQIKIDKNKNFIGIVFR